MTETLIESIVPSDRPLFHRRIEFVPAKKPFTGFSNGGGGFRLETLNPTSLVPQRGGGSNQGALAVKKPEFWDVGLDSELSPGITFTRIGAGLENLGNTSFLNSVLQCLTYTEPLAAYLQSGKHQNSCRTAGFCALCALQKHVCRALLSTGRSLSPNDLVSNLRCISRNFLNARQEDAHEYMINLLESMHRCCLPAGIPSESPSAYEKSLVHKIFGGCLHSQVECTQCSACSNKFDPFLDLSLEIIKAESLSKALMHFTAKEYLDGGEQQYQCQTCKQKVKALKQLTIHKAPYVLTIHLKRFGTHQPGKKIDKNVQFGTSLDLKPFVTGSYDGDLRYTLCSVLVHAGSSIHSGHYSSFVRTSAGMWFSLDDHQVHQVSEKKVLDQKAYILFYVRDRSNFAPKKPVEVVPKETGHKVNDRNKDRGGNTDLIDMVAMTPNCCLPEKIVTKKEEHYEDVTGKFEPLRSLDRLNRVNSRIDGLAKESALSDGGQPTEVVELVELSGLGTTQLPLDQEILNYKLQRRKKMLSKCQVTSMRLGPRILFGASLIPWKKKHKKIKQCDDNISNCPQQQLLGREFSPTDLGPSSSERIRSLSIGGRKGLKSDSSKNTNSAVAKDVEDYIDDSADWISRDKFGQNGATLQPQRSCSSPLAGNQQNNLRANGSTENRSDSEQDGSTRMLTRGLQETVVEPWNGIKLPSSQNTESSVMKSASIGYVADEWDEEYDKGKRKKLRISNIVFDGQNPFQEIATKKAKLKKARLGQSTSRN